MMVDNGMKKDRLTTKVERLQIVFEYCLRERLDIHVLVKEFLKVKQCKKVANLHFCILGHFCRITDL